LKFLNWKYKFQNYLTKCLHSNFFYQMPNLHFRTVQRNSQFSNFFQNVFRTSFNVPSFSSSLAAKLAKSPINKVTSSDRNKNSISRKKLTNGQQMPLPRGALWPWGCTGSGKLTLNLYIHVFLHISCSILDILKFGRVFKKLLTNLLR